MNRTGICSAWGTTTTRFPRQLGEHAGWRSSECEFEPRYTQGPAPDGMTWHCVAIAALALACFAAVGVLLAWRG